MNGLLLETLFRIMSSAGFLKLISFLFCRREQLKQAIAGDKSNKEKTRKASTLLCAKKNQKKKKKKSPHNAYTDGSYPLYSSSTTDGKLCFLESLLFEVTTFLINSLPLDVFGKQPNVTGKVT